MWAITAVATAAVLTAGGITAYTLLSGSSITLDAKVPANSVAYVEVNLDPPAGQKLAALHFFHHFPNLNVPQDAQDLVQGLIQPLITSGQDRQRFAADIQPWLGKHAAFAAAQINGTVEPIIVLDCTNTAAAQSGLQALLPAGQSRFGYVISDGQVVLARSQAVAQAASDAAKSQPLRDNGTFQHDIGVVGDNGVLTAWVDVAGAAKLAKSAGGGTVPQLNTANLQGRLAASLTFTDTTADLTMRGIGLAASDAGPAIGSRLATLPDDTAFAIALSNADKGIRRAYAYLQQTGLTNQLQSLQSRLGITLPDDLATLVGSSTVIAIGGAPHQVDIGMISGTTDSNRAETIANQLLAALHATASVTVRSGANGTVLASSPSYADKLAGSGGLGNSAQFRDAMPDLNSAQFALYVDLQRITELGSSSLPAQVAALRAVGLTVSASGGIATLHLKLVVG